MQIWLYFIGGAGGDSIANLLEHADNVEPVDGNVEWRISHYIDNLACWWAPCFDHEQCFRSASPFPFRASSNAMSDRYKHLVQQNIPTIITSHDVMLNAFNSSDECNILRSNQIKILVKHTDPAESFKLCQLKNFATGSIIADPQWCRQIQKVPDHFDYVLDVSQCHQDWQYAKEFCNNVGLNLCYNVYKQWQDLLHWNTSSLKEKFKCWRSQQHNGIVAGYVECLPN